MKNVRESGLYFVWILLFLCMTASCSRRDMPEPDPTPQPPEPLAPVELKISADKTSIKANGTDSALFTVTAD